MNKIHWKICCRDKIYNNISREKKMIEAIYIIFFWILVLEVLLFMFLNMPTPRGWKSKIIKFLINNKSIKTIMKLHLGCCFVAALFFYDCYRTENMFL